MSVNQLAWFLGVVLLALQGYYVGHYNVDIPFSSDWIELVPERGFSRDFSWKWILGTTNGHARMLHSFFRWLNLIVTDGHYPSLAVFNYLQYALGSMMILFWLERRFQAPLGWMVVAAASTLGIENHHWALGVVFFHFIFFGFWAIFLSFERGWRSWLGFLCAHFALFSTSAGYVFAGIYCLSLVLWPWVHRKAGESVRYPEIALSVGRSAWILGLLLTWRSVTYFDNGFEHVHSPLRPAVWAFFLNMLSYAYGWLTISVWPALGGLVVLAYSVVALGKRGYLSFSQSPRWFSLGLMILLILGVCGAVSAGRVEQWGIAASKTSRYTGYTYLLPALIFLFIWHLSLLGPPFRRKKAAGLYLLIALVGIGENYHYEKKYEVRHAMQMKVLTVVRNYANGLPIQHVLGSPRPENLPDYIRRVEELHLGFWKRIQEEAKIAAPARIERATSPKKHKSS